MPSGSDTPFVSIKGDPSLGEKEKIRTIAWVRARIQSGPLRHYLPAPWLKLMDEERAGWQPLAAERIDEIVHSFNVLRSIEGYYLRNAAISLSEGIVRASCTATAPTSCGRTASPNSSASTRPEHPQSSGVST